MSWGLRVIFFYATMDIKYGKFPWETSVTLLKTVSCDQRALIYHGKSAPFCLLRAYKDEEYFRNVSVRPSSFVWKFVKWSKVMLVQMMLWQTPQMFQDSKNLKIRQTNMYSDKEDSQRNNSNIKYMSLTFVLNKTLICFYWVQSWYFLSMISNCYTSKRSFSV